MIYVVVAILVAGAFLVGWYAGVADAKYHITNKMGEGQKALTPDERLIMRALLDKVSKAIK